MKKSLFVIVILSLFCVTDIFSQARIGVKGALNMATIKGEEDNEGVESIFGPQAGVVVYSNLQNPVFIQSGLLYSVKGAKGAGFEDAEVKLTYSFLELPVNLGFQLPIGGSVKLGPYIGGYAAYALSGKVKMDGVSFDIFDLDTEDGPKRLDYGANVGVGVHFNDRIIISGQYSHGLANIGDSESSSHTRAFSAGLTFLF